MPRDTEESSRAFNRGCDARLAGRPLSANPYDYDNQFFRRWRDGWIDVHKHWGERSCFAKPLPKVRT